MVNLLSNVYRKRGRYNLYPEKKEDISKISLPHQTIARRIEETGKSIKRHLESKAANFKFYTLVMGDSTDATDRAQLAIFIRGI